MCDLPHSVHLGLIRIVLQRRWVIVRVGLLAGPGCRRLLLEHRHGAQRLTRRYEAQAVGVHLRWVTTITVEVGVEVGVEVRGGQSEGRGRGKVRAQGRAQGRARARV